MRSDFVCLCIGIFFEFVKVVFRGGVVGIVDVGDARERARQSRDSNVFMRVPAVSYSARTPGCAAADELVSGAVAIRIVSPVAARYFALVSSILKVAVLPFSLVSFAPNL